MKYLVIILSLVISASSFAKDTNPKGNCNWISVTSGADDQSTQSFQSTKVRLNGCIEQGKGIMMSAELESSMIMFKTDKTVLYFELRLSEDGQSVEVLESSKDAYEYYSNNMMIFFPGTPIKN